MDTAKAYNEWSEQYDTNLNKTRDLEGVVLRKILGTHTFDSVLEIGCGTGKNTEWLTGKCQHITAVDLSEKMLEKAKEKIQSPKVHFIKADINKPWDFTGRNFDLVTCSLVLEHIERLEPVFQKISRVLSDGGLCYIGELHPFKQYSGSQARFDTREGRQYVKCYLHHVSEFMHAAANSGLQLVELEEYFDDNDKSSIPRILSLLFKKIS